MSGRDRRGESGRPSPRSDCLRRTSRARRPAALPPDPIEYAVLDSEDSPTRTNESFPRAWKDEGDKPSEPEPRGRQARRGNQSRQRRNQQRPSTFGRTIPPRCWTEEDGHRSTTAENDRIPDDHLCRPLRQLETEARPDPDQTLLDPDPWRCLHSHPEEGEILVATIDHGDRTATQDEFGILTQEEGFLTSRQFRDVDHEVDSFNDQARADQRADGVLLPDEGETR